MAFSLGKYSLSVSFLNYEHFDLQYDKIVCCYDNMFLNNMFLTWLNCTENWIGNGDVSDAQNTLIPPSKLPNKRQVTQNVLFIRSY